MIKDKKDDQLTTAAVSNIIDERLSPKAKDLVAKLFHLEKTIKYKWLSLKVGNSKNFDFRDYMSLKEFFKVIYYRNLSLEDAERKQEEFNGILGALEKYVPRKFEYLTTKNDLLTNSKKLFDGREMILNVFKNKAFPFEEEESDDDDLGKSPDDDESDDEFYTPKELEIILEPSNFENEEETPRDMPDLQTEESAEQRRKTKGHGLKILTPEQMLSRLPISLAQLKAGNNSEKLKNEIRQLLYSLYRSKKLSKTIYEHLINAI